MNGLIVLSAWGGLRAAGSGAEAPVVQAAEADAGQSEQRADLEKPALLLPPYAVTAQLFKPPVTPLEKSKFQLFLDFNWRLSGWPVLAGDFVVTPERASQYERNSVFAVAVFEPGSDATFPAEMGMELPEFADVLERDAFGRHEAVRGGKEQPVLLDGVRANDSFDGTVHWSELPHATLFRLEAVPLGGATAWGEASAGIVQLFTVPVNGRRVVEPPLPGADPNVPRQLVHGTGLATAEVGEFGSYGMEFVHTEPTRAGMVQVLARANTTDGFVATLPEWRSAIDQAGWARDTRLEARWRQPLGKKSEVTATIWKTVESRGLGTADQSEHSRAEFASMAFAGESAGGLAWNGTIYARNQDSNRTFSAVDRSRAAEARVFDEFAEPVVSWGASWTGLWRHDTKDARTNFGFDFRAVRGEARSEFGASNGTFTLERAAGAQQASLGGFVIHNRELARRLRGMLGVRFDWRREADGRVREADRASGETVREVHEPDVREVEFSPSGGLVWTPRAGWRLRLGMQESFRPPTLADRYRAFGANNRLIEPNANLRTERSTSAEASIEYTPADAVTLSARAFVNRLRDAFGTYAVPLGSGETLEFATLPATVEQRRRVNLDEVRVQGVEFSLSGRPQKTLSIKAGIRLEHAEIRRAAQSPSLAGNDLPGSPHGEATASANWQVSRRVSLHATVRWLGREFVDEENSRGLGEAVMVGCGVSYELSSRSQLFFQVANIGDARVEVDRGGDGAGYGGAPRRIGGGVRVSW